MFDCCSFLKFMMLVGGGLVLGVVLMLVGVQDVKVKLFLLLQVFIIIVLDNIVIVVVNWFEFGQGVYMVLFMVLVEEFDVDWCNVCGMFVFVGDLYKDLGFGIQMMGGLIVLNYLFQ